MTYKNHRLNSMKPRDPYSAMAASDAFCCMVIEAQKKPQKAFGQRPLPPQNYHDSLDEALSRGDPRQIVCSNCCPEGRCLKQLAERRRAFLFE